MTVLAPALVAALLTAAPSSPQVKILNRRVERNQVLATALRAAGLDGGQTDRVVAALQGVFDFRKSRVGDQLRLVFRDGELDHLDYRQSPVDEWQVRRDGEKYVARKREVEVETQVSRVELEVASSLYDAAVTAKEDPTIAMALADVFAWDIDFYVDVRKGDRVRCLVEKVLSKGRLLRYGEVLAAEYRGEAVGTKRVFRWQLPDGEWSYFQEDGTSARKAFLKSPLKFAHVTSRFGMRFHPVLEYLKAHQGVDYAAAVGTPVWSVADGTVTVAGNTGAGGNTVCVRHRNGFETCYLHLSSYGSGVRSGARVAQKQVIGYSGSTGRVTGPHLHFAMKRNGAFVNPLNQKFPRSEPVPATLLARFRAAVVPVAASLDAPSLATVTRPGN
jgi:murein DD-endopeptidase MepM/ murein hydrolase activator NlpD